MVIRFVSTTNRPDVSKSRDFIIFCDKVFYFRPLKEQYE